MYAFPQPQTVRRPQFIGRLRGGRLRGAGPATGTVNTAIIRVPPVHFQHIISPITASAPPPVTTPAQTAGTPVPPNFSQNQIFVSSTGAQYIYSTSQGKWISVGTPYNPNAPSATTPAATGASYYPGSPVPASWPTSQVFVDSAGNQWYYNAGYGTFQPMSNLATSSTLSTSSSGALPTGVVSSPYSSVLSWLSQADLLPPIPNWGVVAGLGFLALKFMPSGGKR